jgi:hypothetical protein
VGFAYTAVRIVDKARGDSRLSYRLPASGMHRVERFVRGHAMDSAYSVPVSPSCAVFRRDDVVRSLSTIVDDPHGLGYMQHGAGPDLQIYLDACANYAYFAHSQRALVAFEQHDSNLTHRPSVRASYHATINRWCARYRMPGVHVSDVRARSWFALRHDPLRAAVVPNLTTKERLRLPGVLCRKAVCRILGPLAEWWGKRE